jgi:uncharacterized protein (DUF433 family)
VEESVIYNKCQKGVEMPITIDEKIMHGRPVIKGTRIPVSIIIGSLADGMTEEEIKQEYGISSEDIRDCLKYSSRIIDNEQVIPMEFDHV